VAEFAFLNYLPLWSFPSNSKSSQQPHWGTGSLLQPQALFGAKPGSEDTMK